MNRRVVITGMGVVAPNAIGIGNFKTALENAQSGIKFIQELKDLNFACQIGGVPTINNDALQPYLQSYNMNNLSLVVRYACLSAIEAWQDAGFEIPDIDSPEPMWDTGLILGTGLAALDVIGQKNVPLVDAGKIKRLGSTMIEQIMVSGNSAYVSGILGLGNQVSTISSACSTGTEALITAYNRVRSGLANRMLAGGSEAYTPYIWGGFDSMRVMNSSSNNQPEAGSKPLSAQANGFVPGSGAGMIVVEELETALQRGAKIYAEIIGGAVNCGGQRMGGSMTAPNSTAVQLCIKTAMADANIQTHQVDAISGHLSSTMADPVEVANWAIALNRKGSDFPTINSTKSLVGHCLGAAGAIESVAAIIQLQNNFMHASLNADPIHPDIANLIHNDCIPHTQKHLPNMQILAKASFGFGDVNSCIIFKKYD